MTIGKKLRDAREKMNLTTSQVAAGTRMKIQIVEALENENFKIIPAPIYVKGFIRLFAEYVGLDAAELITDYNNNFANPLSQHQSDDSSGLSSAFNKHAELKARTANEETPKPDPITTTTRPVQPATPKPQPTPAPAPANDDDLFSHFSKQNEQSIEPEESNENLSSLAARLQDDLSKAGAPQPEIEEEPQAEPVYQAEQDNEHEEDEQEDDYSSSSNSFIETITDTFRKVVSSTQNIIATQKNSLSEINVKKAPVKSISLGVAVLVVIILLISGISRLFSSTDVDSQDPDRTIHSSLQINVDLPEPYFE